MDTLDVEGGDSEEKELDSEDVVGKVRTLFARASALLDNVDRLLASHPIQEDNRTVKSRSIKPAKEPIEGLRKFRSAVKSEHRFLEKVLAEPVTIKKAHASCSNIPYLNAVYTLAQTLPGVTHVWYRREDARVDIVADHGRSWVKVKASALKGMQSELDEEEWDSSDSEDDVPDQESNIFSPLLPIYKQAKELLEAANKFPVHYQPPQVVMVFLCLEDVDQRIVERLREMGLVVKGMDGEATSTNGVANAEGVVEPLIVKKGIDPDLTATMNLDVTTLIVLVTDITHRLSAIPSGVMDIGSLRLQMRQENAQPLLPLLHQLLSNRTLVTTHSACTKFFELLCLLGGTSEKIRARYLIEPGPLSSDLLSQLPEASEDPSIRPGPLPLVKVIPDDPSPRFLPLLDPSHPAYDKFERRHVLVFGTGDILKACTVTANAKVERQLEDVGIQGLSVWVHDPRSLVGVRINDWKERPEVFQEKTYFF
ncbi:hypothetical protein HDU85_006594 [Gaertneriomyces sp. JEL0708]|nr:hypothetical protein HDU85_006594 [Gaertneriomyces sp. JEL0708]